MKHKYVGLFKYKQKEDYSHTLHCYGKGEGEKIAMLTAYDYTMKLLDETRCGLYPYW